MDAFVTAPVSMPIRTPTFELCGKFDGDNGQSPSKWLRKYEFDLSTYYGQVIPPRIFLQHVEFLLVNDAEKWLDKTPMVSRLVMKADPTIEDVDLFKACFIDRFPVKDDEPIPFDFDTEISELRQGDTEPLKAYYRRTYTILKDAGAHDRTPGTFVPSVKVIILNTTIKAFIRGIKDRDVRQETIKRLFTVDSSLASTYSYADGVRRSKIEQEKWHQADLKDTENTWLKTLALQNMSIERFNALRANAIASSSHSSHHVLVPPPGPPAYYHPQAMQAQGIPEQPYYGYPPSFLPQPI